MNNAIITIHSRHMTLNTLSEAFGLRVQRFIEFCS